MELTARREAIVELRAKFTLLSERRACELVGIQRSSYRYRGTRKAADAPLTKRMQELALEYPRFGYRRLGVLLRREGNVLNEKKVHRVYQSAGLALRQLKRKRIHRQPVPLVRLTEPNQEWAMDFVHDAATNGQTLRFFGVVDQYSRTCVRLAVDTSMPARRVIQELETAIGEYGKPSRIRMDNGSEFTSRRFLAWCTEQKIEMVHIRPGKPVENAHSESFNGRLREEFLNVTQFQHLWDAQAKARRWFQYYNEERPHSSLDYRTPQEFATAYSALRAPQAVANAPSVRC